MRYIKRISIWFLLPAALAAVLFYLWGSALEQGFDTPTLPRIEKETLPREREANQEEVNKVEDAGNSITPPSNTSIIIEGVPFTPQAPFGNWADSRQQDGCEEASSLMAVRWALGKPLSLREAEVEILAASAFEQEHYGSFHDTSAEDTAERIIRRYFGYEKVEVYLYINSEDIIVELEKGNLVIVPTNGQDLQNPYFTQPGPERHMLVVKGYDRETQEFITNDNGTKRGEGYRYKQAVLEAAIQDYPTGNHVPAVARPPAMIVVQRSVLN